MLCRRALADMPRKTSLAIIGAGERGKVGLPSVFLVVEASLTRVLGSSGGYFLLDALACTHAGLVTSRPGA